MSQVRGNTGNVTTSTSTSTFGPVGAHHLRVVAPAPTGNADTAARRYEVEAYPV